MADLQQRARDRLDRLRLAGRLLTQKASAAADVKVSNAEVVNVSAAAVVNVSAMGDLHRDIFPAPLASDGAVVTNRLFDRLEPEDIEEIERRIEASGEFEALPWRGPDEAYRRFLILALGLWLGVTEVSDRTGLSHLSPPDDVHAMARGPEAAAGGLYEADMVISGLQSAGVEIDAVRRGLDFGCSSGRVVRVLAAAYPGVSWQGCDPNGPAIAWAQANLPGIEFSVSGNEPPLPFGDGELDLAFAVSVWSHFEPDLGLRWFEEMRRILRPGGYLAFTTHGLMSIEHLHSHGVRSLEQSLEIERALYSSGTWYAEEFGEQGDWGVVNPSWGTAFLSPEWVLMNLCPRWRVAEFAPGRNAANQDVYVLQRS